MIIRLNEYIDGGKSPAFAKVLADHPEWRRMMSPTRAIFTASRSCAATRSANVSGPFVRKDYMEKLGINAAPKTIDDWTAMFQKIKGQDLNGNGQQDEYAFTSWLFGEGNSHFNTPMPLSALWHHHGFL